MNHPIYCFPVTHLDTLTHPEQVVGRIAHALLSARYDNTGISKLDSLCGQHHRFQAGAAYFIHREGFHTVG